MRTFSDLTPNSVAISSEGSKVFASCSLLKNGTTETITFDFVVFTKLTLQPYSYFEPGLSFIIARVCGSWILYILWSFPCSFIFLWISIKPLYMDWSWIEILSISGKIDKRSEAICLTIVKALLIAALIIFCLPLSEVVLAISICSLSLVS